MTYALLSMSLSDTDRTTRGHHVCWSQPCPRMRRANPASCLVLRGGGTALPVGRGSAAAAALGRLSLLLRHLALLCRSCRWSIALSVRRNTTPAVRQTASSSRQEGP